MILANCRALCEYDSVLQSMGRDHPPFSPPCAGKAGNPFQTTQGNRLSCSDQEGRRGSDEAVPGPSVLPSREPGVSGNFWRSHEGCQGPFCPLGRNRGLPLRRRRGQGCRVGCRGWLGPECGGAASAMQGGSGGLCGRGLDPLQFIRRGHQVASPGLSPFNMEHSTPGGSVSLSDLWPPGS